MNERSRTLNHLLISLFLLISNNSYSGEYAQIHEPIKKEYKQSLLDGIKSTYKQTGEFKDSFSMICDMGEAIEIEEKEGWYSNNPVPGLKLELRARAVTKMGETSFKASGFVVVTKNGDDLIVFKPIGNLENGVWNGDVFNSWDESATEIEVRSGRFGNDGYASFDLLDGKGFFYRNNNPDPEYFLFNCKRIKKTGLPVYDWYHKDTESNLDLNG
ncbi:hypothetical protein ACFODZ_08650 [Marinicella sediminis]|uniref:Uncharacterized protein n=1 Tax=Marinicella sediminis TaxID=1792834 RepID=A0ABV7JCA5_9GAMM|nr:hypothetical protein [Marinicella sediminis]